MDTLEQSELTVSVHFFARFLNQEYQFTIPNSRIRLSKKQEKERRTQTIANRYAFHANTIKKETE